jgi:hypothetical protein
MSKLTLSVDKDIVSRAKQYAEQHGISISKMVESYLAVVSGSIAGPHAGQQPGSAPRMNSLRGILKNADVNDYRKHLASKY